MLAAFDCLYYFKKRYLICRLRQFIAAVYTWNSPDDAVLPQLGHNFRKIALRNAKRSGQWFDSNVLATIHACQVNESMQRIIGTFGILNGSSSPLLIMDLIYP